MKKAFEAMQKMAECAAKLELRTREQTLAVKLVQAGAQPSSVSDLSPEARKAIQKVKDEGDLQVSSRCHWMSGCLDCHVGNLLPPPKALSAGSRTNCWMERGSIRGLCFSGRACLSCPWTATRLNGVDGQSDKQIAGRQ